MAHVIQCDACGRVCKAEDAHIIDIIVMRASCCRGNRESTQDICPECYKKVKEVLKIDK